MNKQQLATKIWESANKMRSKIEANDYKDYILGFIFYKYLSDKELKFLKEEGLSPEDIEALADWLAALSPDIPLHLTRYFPQYHWSAPVTPVETLKKLQAAAIPYLHYVYLGNV